MSGIERLSDAAKQGSTPPLDGQLYIYNSTTGKYQPTANPSTPTNLVPLQRARQALAACNQTPMKWLAMGDSVTEGSGAGAVTTGVGQATPGYLQNRYINRTLKTLQSRYTDAGVGGTGLLWTGSYVVSQDSASTNYWTFSGGGLGGAVKDYLVDRFWSHTTNTTATLTFTGTGIDVISYASGAATTYSYAIDGGGSTTVTAPSGGIVKQTAQIRGLTAGVHTIVFTPPAGGQLYVRGVFIYNGDEAAGIHLYDSGHFGVTSAQYLAGAAASAALTQPLTEFTPHLVTILLGFNDYQANVDPATFQANLAGIIANVKALCTVTPSFLLMTPYQRGDVASPTYPWSQYVAACNAVAAADPTNVAALSFTDRMGSPQSANGYDNGLTINDRVHPTRQGHNYMAQALATLLAPA